MTSGPLPPRWATKLLARALPPGTAGSSVQADLREEFQEWVQRDGERRARRRYAWEALKLASHFALGAARAGRVGEAGISTHRKGGSSMEARVRDVRIALRGLVRAPAFALTAIVTIALGIGANVVIFSVVDAVLLEPLPYDEPDELIAIWEANRSAGLQSNVANPGNFSAWRDGSDAVRRMTAVSLAQPTTVIAAGEPDEAMMQYAAPDFFDVLGLEAAVGRTFDPAPAPDQASEVVISDRYWRERFGADPGVVGRTVQLNAATGVIVGVLPPAYVVFGEGTSVWASVALDRGDQTNTGRWLMVVGRLAPDASVEVADEELRAIASALEVEFPEFNAGWTVRLVPLRDEVVGDVRRTLWILLGAVALLLLIACANVANLFLVRSTERQKEMAVRTSLGASGRALVGQLLTESLLVAGMGATVGVAAAAAATSWLATSIPEALSLPRIEGVGLDAGVLGFAAAVTAGTALLFGLFPALEASRTPPAATLGAESRGPSRSTGVVRDLLVVGEVALSVVLLAGAALFLRSFHALGAIDDGIEAEQVLVGRVNLAGDGYDDDQTRVAFFEQLYARLDARPEVQIVGGVTFLPMDGAGAATGFWPGDRAVPAPDERPAADIRNVSGDYFEAMGIELLQGRLFDDRDRADAPQTVVVGRTLARSLWPHESAIGKPVIVQWVDETPWEIVGVVEDVRLEGPATPPGNVIYIHYAKGTFFPWQQVAVRTTGDPATVANVVRTELATLDDRLPLGSVRVMSDIVDRSVARPRVTRSVMALFAAFATLLAAVGLYGVLAYAVSRRVREIGVRIALGAEPRGVARLIVRQGARLVGIGLLVGTAAALLGTRLIASLLFEVPPYDPIALGAAGGALGLVALLACVVPAWRASNVAPGEALRAE